MSGTKPGNRYFSHDSDAFLDSRIIKMRAKLGLAGYGAYWMIIERLRTTDKYRHECDYDVFACLANSDAELFKSVIEDFDLFEFEEENGQVYFYSASLLRRMLHMEDIIEKRREAGRKGAEARWQTDDKPVTEPKVNHSKGIASAMPIAKQVPCDCHSTALAKNGKLNQTKLNKTKLKETSKVLMSDSDESTVDDIAKKNVQDERFNEFWQLYPKKIGKKAARQAWMRLKPNKELFDKIIEAVKTQKLSEQWTKENGKYIPHPTTWLNQGRWDDELPRGNGKPYRDNRGNFKEGDKRATGIEAGYDTRMPRLEDDKEKVTKAMKELFG